MPERRTPSHDQPQNGDVFILGGNFVISNQEHSQIRHDNILKAVGKKGGADDSKTTTLFSDDHIAFDAMHTSAQRYPPPRCHPGTRDSVLGLIAEWISSRRSPHSILWLYGTAGVGKSAVMQTTCETFLSKRGPVAAAFFFARGQGQRANGQLLPSTLAFQLVENLPGYRRGLQKVLTAHPNLHKQSIGAQFTALLIDAINNIHWWSSWGSATGSPTTIVIDGLDECDGEGTHTTIIEFLYEAARASKGNLRFLIASRPESHILAAFNQPHLSQVTKRVPLDETFKPADAIRLYLRIEFQNIAKANVGLLPKSGWPADGIIEILVQAAWGQFIFAHLVITFVRMPRQDPQKQLQIVLDASQNAVAFSPLDALYTQILDNIPLEQQTILRRVIGCMVVLAQPLPISNIASLVSVDEASGKLILDQLRAVLLAGSDIDRLFVEPVRFAHASFRDYLVDPRRSGPYTVDQPTCHAALVHRYLDTIPFNSNAIIDLPHPHHTVSASAYAYLDRYIHAHIQHAPLSLIQDAIVEEAQTLLFNPHGYPPHICPSVDDDTTYCPTLFLQAQRLANLLPNLQKFSIDFGHFYTNLLDAVPSDQLPSLMLVLRCIAFLKVSVSSKVVADITGIPSAEIEATINDFPVLTAVGGSFPQSDHYVYINSDFQSFLQDPRRAGKYLLDEEFCHRQFVSHWLKTRFGSNVSEAVTIRYLDAHIAAHALQCDTQELCQELSDHLPADFRYEQYLYERSGYSGQVLAREELRCLREILVGHKREHRYGCPHSALTAKINALRAWGESAFSSFDRTYSFD